MRCEMVGIWAIDVAEKYPSADVSVHPLAKSIFTDYFQVLGLDIAAVQLEW